MFGWMRKCCLISYQIIHLMWILILPLCHIWFKWLLRGFLHALRNRLLLLLRFIRTVYVNISLLQSVYLYGMEVNDANAHE